MTILNYYSLSFITLFFGILKFSFVIDVWSTGWHHYEKLAVVDDHRSEFMQAARRRDYVEGANFLRLKLFFHVEIIRNLIRNNQKEISVSETLQNYFWLQVSRTVYFAYLFKDLGGFFVLPKVYFAVVDVFCENYVIYKIDNLNRCIFILMLQSKYVHDDFQFGIKKYEYLLLGCSHLFIEINQNYMLSLAKWLNSFSYFIDWILHIWKSNRVICLFIEEDRQILFFLKLFDCHI